MNNLIFFTLLTMLYTSSAFSDSAASQPTSDYDRICGYFVQLEDAISKNDLATNERGQFISTRVDKEIAKQSDARALWEVIRYAAPDERYEMFKTTAEEQAGHTWECASMENLIKSAGE